MFEYKPLERAEYSIEPTDGGFAVRYSGRDMLGNDAGSEIRGEYEDPDVAYHVAYALCRRHHQLAGYEIDDPRFQYPQRIGSTDYQNWVA